MAAAVLLHVFRLGIRTRLFIFFIFSIPDQHLPPWFVCLMSQVLFLPLLVNKALFIQVHMVDVGIFFLKHCFVRLRFKENLCTRDSDLK